MMTGSYPDLDDMRLGDLQRSASRILNIAMQSAPFARARPIQGVHGIKVGSYTGQFRHLDQPVTVAKGKVPPRRWQHRRPSRTDPSPLRGQERRWLGTRRGHRRSRASSSSSRTSRRAPLTELLSDGRGGGDEVHHGDDRGSRSPE